MPTDRTVLKDIQQAQLLGHTGQQGVTDPPTAVAEAHQRHFTALVSDSATAGTAVTETVMFRANVAMRIKRVDVTAPISVTANDTTYATVTVAQRDSAGANSATIATQTTKTSGSGGLGSLTAFKPYALTLTNANVDVPAGSVVTIAIAKASAGVALTAATSYFEVCVVAEEV